MPLNLALFFVWLAVAIPFCIAFVDRPVAAFCAGLKPWRLLFQLCAAPSLLPLPLAGLYLAYGLIRRLCGRPPFAPLALAAALATLTATAAKDELKFIFGRPWPHSFLQYGLYAFRPLTDSALYGGFPSGHTAYAAAPLGVFWALAPRFRPLYAVILALVMFGLVAANYHFVGDVLAGLLTGLICAWGALILTRTVA